MRFAPVEVVTRYYQNPIVAPREGVSEGGPSSPSKVRVLGYPTIHAGDIWLGEQAYEHDFEVHQTNCAPLGQRGCALHSFPLLC